MLVVVEEKVEIMVQVQYLQEWQELLIVAVEVDRRAKAVVRGAAHRKAVSVAARAPRVSSLQPRPKTPPGSAA